MRRKENVKKAEKRKREKVMKRKIEKDEKWAKHN